MEISEITRHNIVDTLILKQGSFHGQMDYMSFLKRVWPLDKMSSTDGRFATAEGDIWQHTVNNNDWDQAYLLYDYLGLRHCPDELFLKFVETTVHPLVDGSEGIAERVQELNGFLRSDGFRLVSTSELSGRPFYKAKHVGALGPAGTPVYEIVLSFAGEDRAYVERVADFLVANEVAVFYDRFEEETLWGKELTEHLDTVYRSSARFCVMFISVHYAEKIWPIHERRSTLARALTERQEYILPARFDDTELPGLRPTVGYVDLRSKTPEDLARLILKKLGRTPTK